MRRSPANGHIARGAAALPANDPHCNARGGRRDQGRARSSVLVRRLSSPQRRAAHWRTRRRHGRGPTGGGDAHARCEQRVVQFEFQPREPYRPDPATNGPQRTTRPWTRTFVDDPAPDVG
jgi:hypothetical protein